MQANNGSDREKFLHAGWLPLNEKGQVKEGMDGSSMDRSKKVQTYPRIWPRVDWNGEKEFMQPTPTSLGQGF